METVLAFLQVHDHLKLEEGSFNQLKSEYKRRFQHEVYQKNGFNSLPRTSKIIKPVGTLKLEGALEFNPEYYESYVEYPIDKSIVQRTNRNLIDSIDHIMGENADNTEDENEDGKNYKFKRHYLFRHPTNLKLEGEFYAETENAEKFIEYLLSAHVRPNLARTSTTLKLEGDMEKKTETSEKYVPFECESRRPLLKNATNLHLEGILDIKTEMREKYLPLETCQRPPLIKRSTSLHLEGDLEMHPEYRDVYIEYKEIERSRPSIPINNLKTEGHFDPRTEKSEKFVEHQIHPIIPFLRGSISSKKMSLGDDHNVKKAEYKEKFVEHSKAERSLQHKPKQNLKSEGDMEVSIENKTQFVEKSAPKTEMRKCANNLTLEGKIDLNPEYTNAYVNFYKDAYGKFGIKKDQNEPETRKRSSSHPMTNLKSGGRVKSNPNLKTSHVNFPKQSHFIKSPDGLRRREDHNIKHAIEKTGHVMFQSKGPKTIPLKKQTDLKLEGPFECQPEYRRAYNDYITREKIERLRPVDNLGVKRFLDDPYEPPPPIISQNMISREVDGNAVLLKAKSQLPLPEVNKNLKLPPASPRSTLSNKKFDQERLVKMENKLFGPKVPNRHASPSRTEAAKRANEDRLRMARSRRRYGSPIMVENLAYTPSPTPAALQDSTRRQLKFEDHNRSQAFVILGSVKGEFRQTQNCFKNCNNNHSDSFDCCADYEHKQMPFWYGPTFK